MSDSFSSSGSLATPPKENSKSTSRVRALFVLNGIVCCVLVVSLIVFGLRRERHQENASDEDASKPIASASDSVDDEDDGDGRPKVITIETKWPESGVADFEFTERSGRKVTNQDLQGHPWVAAFIFTNCAGPCFKVSAAMRALQDEFGKDTDLRLVSFTVDPERDTPEVLAKYAKGFQADPDKWLFLTGDKDKLYHLIWGSFLMPVREEEGERRQPGYEFIHTTNILLVDEKGVVQGKWSSTDEAEFSQLRRLLRKRFGKGGEGSKLETPPAPEAIESEKPEPDSQSKEAS